MSVSETSTASESTTVIVSLPAGSEFGEPASRMPERAVHPFGWTRRDFRRALALGFAFVIAVIFLWQVQAILPPFLIAFFLAALLDPTLRYFERQGHTRVRAILTLYTAGLTLVGLFCVFVIPAVRTQVEDISGNLDVYYLDIQQSADGWMRHNRPLLLKLGIRQYKLSELLDQKSSPVRSKITAALSGLTLVLSGAASKILWLVIIPLAGFFFMRDYPILRARIIALFPDAYHDQVDIMTREIVDVFGAYLRGLAKICSLYALVAFVLFSLLGLKYALFLALAAGAFYAVPYVGQLFTAVATGAVAYTMAAHRVLFMFAVPAHSTPYTVFVVLTAILAQNIFDQILYPRIVGGSVGLHPVVSIFALMAGATLFSFWGMLVAVPVAASIQILILYFFPKLQQPPPAHLLDTPPPLA